MNAKNAKRWLNNITNLWRKKWSSIVTVLLVLAVLDDLLSVNNYIPHITVRVEYLDVLYGALCSVAVLGNAVLTIVVGVLDAKVYGLSIREISTASPFDFDVTTTLVFSSVAVVLGIPALAFNACTCITVLLISVVLIILGTSVELWGILSDDQRAKAKIQSIIANKKIGYDVLYAKWFPEIKVAIESRDEEKQEKFTQLIHSTVISTNSSDKPQIDTLQKGITELFPLACKTLGFTAAYRRFIDLGSNEDGLFDTYMIVKNYAKIVMYSNDQQIGDFLVPKAIEDILDYSDIPKKERSQCAFFLYRAIRDNPIISVTVRNGILRDVFGCICRLRDTCHGDERLELLLKILKVDILENDDRSAAKENVSLLVCALHNENRIFGETCYVSLLSQAFRAFYFWTVLESDTLSNSHRTHLSKLFHHCDDKKNAEAITFMTLLTENKESVLEWLANDITATVSHFFDYFPSKSFVKRSVWIFENLVQFFFIYYLIVGDDIFPIPQILGNENIQEAKRDEICKLILRNYDDQHEKSELCRNWTTKMQDFLGVEGGVTDDLLEESCKLAADYHTQFQRSRHSELASAAILHADGNKLNDLVIKKSKLLHSFKYTDALESSHVFQYSTAPITRHAEEADLEAAADRLLRSVGNCLNEIVATTLPEICLSFDQEGVNRLLTYLQSGGIKARNYTYVNDWGLKSEVRESKEYQELCEYMKAIPKITGRELTSRVFLKMDTIRFNLRILEYSLSYPSQGEADAYVRQNAVSKDRYRIDGDVLAYAEAIERVLDEFVVENVTFEIATDLDVSSGYSVSYSRKK